MRHISTTAGAEQNNQRRHNMRTHETLQTQRNLMFYLEKKGLTLHRIRTCCRAVSSGEMAADSGLTLSTLQRMETGSNTSLTNMVLFCIGAGLKPSSLFTLIDMEVEKDTSHALFREDRLLEYGLLLYPNSIVVSKPHIIRLIKCYERTHSLIMDKQLDKITPKDVDEIAKIFQK